MLENYLLFHGADSTQGSDRLKAHKATLPSSAARYHLGHTLPEAFVSNHSLILKLYSQLRDSCCMSES